jgi:hypothetical protein
VAGTENGLFWYDQDEQLWKRTGKIGEVVGHSQRPVRRGATTVSRSRREAAVKTARQIEGSVLAMAPVGGQLYAVTSQGVYASDDPIGLWAEVPGLSTEPWQFVASSRGVTMLASLRSITLSLDGGRTWLPVSLPANLSQVSALAVDDQGELWVGGRQGVFLSTDKGASWATLKNLYVSDVNGIYFDSRNERVLVTANASTTMAFAVHLANKSVTYWDTGWHLRFVRPVGDYLVGATLFDGIVLQPRMVQSKEVASH